MNINEITLFVAANHNESIFFKDSYRIWMLGQQFLPYTNIFLAFCRLFLFHENL